MIIYLMVGLVSELALILFKMQCGIYVAWEEIYSIYVHFAIGKRKVYFIVFGR